MTTKKLLSLQLKCLLSSIAEHGKQHFSQIEADLLQTNFLLTEAIDKLNASFLAIHASVRAQQKIIDSLLAEPANAGEHVAQLEAVAMKVDVHVRATVTGLQFQDMTDQLISRAVQRVAGLSGVLGILSASGSEMVAETGIEEIVNLLTAVNRSLEQQSGKLEADLWKSVSQTHMECGDIEMF